MNDTGTDLASGIHPHVQEKVERVAHRVERVGPEAAADVLTVIRAAFGARPPLDPPATALSETVETVTDELAAYGGLLVRGDDGEPIAALLYEDLGGGDPALPGPPAEAGVEIARPGVLALRRVCVLPSHQGHGFAEAMVSRAFERVGGPDSPFRGIEVLARRELPGTVAFWRRMGFEVVAARRHDLILLWQPTVHAPVADRDATLALAERLGAELRAGDVVILTGGLGAGKTTFTQGLGTALAVRGAVTSPTFVISRVHPSLASGPALVHVDAYRLGGLAELDDLDLDTSLDEAVTVVEWGGGVAEGLADDRLEIEIRRVGGSDDDEAREFVIRPVGRRWLGVLS